MELITQENQLAIEVSRKLAEFEKQVKAIQLEETALKQALLEEMRSRGIVKLETDDLTIAYIAPTDRESFDSKRFRAENPNLYDEYVTFTRVKDSIRIKLKS